MLETAPPTTTTTPHPIAPSARQRPHCIAEAFYKTTIHPEERSCGNRDDTTPTSLIDLTILEPQDERSKHQAYWAVGLSNLIDEGWRLCYTDGTGREQQVAAGVYSEDRKGNPPRTYGAFGGSSCSVADGERLAIALASEEEEVDMIWQLSDSQAAIQAVRNLSKGKPPRSHIECRIKKALLDRTRDIGILWIKGHIGIPGNEEADKRAEFESILGELSGARRIATEEGVLARSRATRKSFRLQPGYNPRSCEWNRHSLSALTWTRTERGPQNKWLHHIEKVPSPSCTCRAAEESGHNVFECPRFRAIWAEFLGDKNSWEELDKPDWRKVGQGNDAWYFEAVEEFFGHLYGAMAGSQTGEN